MKKSLTLSFYLVFTSLFAFGQSPDEAIKATVTNYFEGLTTGDTAKLGKAFHASAILRTVNASTGKIQDFPIKSFISKTPAGGVKATTKLISYSYAGISGLAAAELQFADFKYIDLLSLLQVNGEWKIVTRVFSRVELDVNLKGSASSSPKAAAPVKRNSANTKPKKDDGW
ncbi:MAG: nuclear transport factor 2 family protein [Bacteroidota bacterium]